MAAAPGRSGIRVRGSAGSTLRVNLGVMRIQRPGLAGHPCRGLCGRGPVPRRAGVRRRLELAHLPGTQWEHPRPGHPHGAAARQEDSARTRAICGMSGRSRARLLCINQVVAKNTSDLAAEVGQSRSSSRFPYLMAGARPYRLPRRLALRVGVPGSGHAGIGGRYGTIGGCCCRSAGLPGYRGGAGLARPPAEIGHTCPAPGPAAPSTAVRWRTRGADRS